MFGTERHKVIAATFATDNTFTTAIYIGGANKVAFEVPTFAVGASTDSCNVWALVANSETDTFRRVKDMGAYSSNSGLEDWEVPSGIGNYTVIVRPVTGFNYVKFEIGQGTTGRTATANLLAKVHVLN